VSQRSELSNKGMKLTKPSVSELRSLSLVFAGLWGRARTDGRTERQRRNRRRQWRLVAAEWPSQGPVGAGFVWGPYILGCLVALTLATVQFIAEGEAALGNPSSPGLLGADLAYWCGVVLGVLVTPLALPRAWPAAARLTALRRVVASGLGPAVPYAAAVVARHMGAISPSDSSLLVEPLLVVLGTVLGAGLVWPVLRADR
jgi:hypothetical protein